MAHMCSSVKIQLGAAAYSMAFIQQTRVIFTQSSNTKHQKWPDVANLQKQGKILKKFLHITCAIVSKNENEHLS